MSPESLNCRHFQPTIIRRCFRSPLSSFLYTFILSLVHGTHCSRSECLLTKDGDFITHPSFLRLDNRPDLSFLIIVNPNNGPGVGALPDPCYSNELRKLNARPNVQTAGYVNVSYCKRPIDEVKADISKYAGWALNTEDTTLAVHGIFLDETPNLYSKEAADYLGQVNHCIKNTHGILENKLVRPYGSIVVVAAHLRTSNH